MSIRVHPCPSVSIFLKHLPALGLLLLFWVMAVTSVLNKSATYDEPLHLAGGYGYWTQNEYKLSTENGNLAQRWATLPLLPGAYRFPSDKEFSNFETSFDFLYNSGNDANAMLLRGRVMIALAGVVLGLLVYVWSSRLFGFAGGLVSLILYTFSPAMLAHSRLVTSDLIVTLCFTASLWSVWQLLHRVGTFTLAAAGLSIGALFVSKMSAVLIIPVGLILLAIRLIADKPLTISFGKKETLIGTRRLQVLVFLCVLVLQTALVAAVVSAFYGFRYSASRAHAAVTVGQDQRIGGNALKVLQKHEQAPQSGNVRKSAPVPGYIKWILQFNRKHHLLPEAYLHGLYVVSVYSLVRPAFFNGEYGTGGWPWFFPYCFLVKTPIAVFVVLFLAALAAMFHWGRLKSECKVPVYKSVGRGFYETSPLWIFSLVYWTVAILTDLNIGERHILPVYPATFILAGAAGRWFQIRGWMLRTVLSVCLIVFAVESLFSWPNYLAYFNQIVGGPKNGYRHLVDSSLDWGQDLPGLKKWLERNRPDGQTDAPVYLSYFGNGNPMYHKIKAERLPGYPDLDIKAHELLTLQGGIYCISATMLQMVHIDPVGLWNEDHERDYQSLLGFARMAQFAGANSRSSKSQKISFPENVEENLKLFPNLQFGRLCAYLRNREPDDYVGYSILIYRLSDHEVQQALFMPYVQLVRGSRPAAEDQP